MSRKHVRGWLWCAILLDLPIDVIIVAPLEVQGWAFDLHAQVTAGVRGALLSTNRW